MASHHPGNDATGPKQPISVTNFASSPSSSPTTATSSGRPASYHATAAAAAHATTIFMGEGTPRHELLRSPHSDSNFSSSPPPPMSALGQQTFLSLPPPSTIHPITSLELRVRWLEALVSGVPTMDGRQPAKSDKSSREASESAHRVGLLKKAADVQQQLDQVVEANAQLRRFMSNCMPSLSFPSNGAFALLTFPSS